MIIDETFALGKRKRGSKVEKKVKNEKKSPKRKRDKKIKTEPKIGIIFPLLLLFIVSFRSEEGTQQAT